MRYTRSTTVIDRLVRELAAAQGVAPLDVVVKLREWIDHDLGTISALILILRGR